MWRFVSKGRVFPEWTGLNWFNEPSDKNQNFANGLLESFMVNIFSQQDHSLNWFELFQGVFHFVNLKISFFGNRED